MCLFAESLRRLWGMGGEGVRARTREAEEEDAAAVRQIEPNGAALRAQEHHTGETKPGWYS